MSFLRHASALALMLCFALPSSGRAWAQATDDSGDPSGAEDDAGEPSPEEPPEIVRARELFLEGAALAKKSRWAEALASFEQSARLRPTP